MRIGRFFGITIRVHLFFVVILTAVSISTYRHWGWEGFQLSSLLLVALVIALVLHELGHGLMARLRGAQVHDILLGPLVSMTRLGRLQPRGESSRARGPLEAGTPEETSLDEFWIALSGPLANLAAAALCLGLALAYSLTLGHGSAEAPGGWEWFLSLFQLPLPLAQEAVLGPREIGLEFLRGLFWFNLFLGLGNLLPAFPMDGGRVLRALLSKRVKASAATRASVAVGRSLALTHGAFCVFLATRPGIHPDSRLLIVLLGIAIALFILSSGEYELRKLALDSGADSNPHPTLSGGGETTPLPPTRASVTDSGQIRRILSDIFEDNRGPKPSEGGPTEDRDA